jgi:hypothetical protein
VVVGYKVDTDNHRILQEMLAEANGFTEGTTQDFPDKIVNRELVVDTGATVVCRRKGLIQEIGLTVEQRAPSHLQTPAAHNDARASNGAVQQKLVLLHTINHIFSKISLSLFNLTGITLPYLLMVIKSFPLMLTWTKTCTVNDGYAN